VTGSRLSAVGDAAAVRPRGALPRKPPRGQVSPSNVSSPLYYSSPSLTTALQ